MVVGECEQDAAAVALRNRVIRGIVLCCWPFSGAVSIPLSWGRFTTRCVAARTGWSGPEDVTVSQAAELSRVKGRIKALTEKTVANGCTEAKAMEAADMVGRLLERYALKHG